MIFHGATSLAPSCEYNYFRTAAGFDGSNAILYFPPPILPIGGGFRLCVDLMLHRNSWVSWICGIGIGVGQGLLKPGNATVKICNFL
jgi:hypothetical protein